MERLFYKKTKKTEEEPAKHITDRDTKPARIDKARQRLEKELERIDFKLMKESFCEYLEDIGLNSEEFLPRIADKDKIQMQAGRILQFLPHMPGSYDEKPGTISMNPGTLNTVDFLNRQMNDGNNPEDPHAYYKKRGDLFTSTLFHEQVHAVSHHDECVGWEKVPWTVGARQRTTRPGGFAKRDEKELLWGMISSQPLAFRLINEAVTDMVAEEIFAIYENKRCAPSADRKSERLAYTKGYQFPRRFTEALTEKISQECGIEKDIIWRGIARGYFSNFDLEGSLMHRLFDEVVPPGFFDRLRKWDGIATLTTARLLIDLKRLNFSDESKKKIRWWFKLVDNA